MKTKVKLMTALLAAIMIVMLLPAVAQAETYEVGNAESFASALDSLEDGDTIKLAADINYTVSTGFAAINVSGKSITFDVGDYTLNVVHTSATALGVDSNGKVELVCGAGEFNVTGLNYGVYASEGEATVTSATGTGDSSSGAYATGAGSKITVTGLAQGVQNGAYAGSGGTVIAGSAAGTGKNGIHASGVGSSITVSGAVDGIENGIYATGGATVVAGSASSTGPTSYGVNVFDAATMVTVNGAVTGVIRAVAVNGGTAVVGSAAATGTGNIGVYATSSGTVTVNGNATGNFAVQAENGATVTVNGDAQGVERGVFAQSGASVTVSNAIATGDIGRGAYAAGGGTITVNGNAAGKAYGAMAEGTSSNIIVSGTARGESTAGVLAKDGGAVEAGAAEGATYGASTSGANSRITVSGAAQGGAYGVYANGGTISAGSATATEAGGQGVLADGGAVEINGDVNGADRGVWAINNSTVAIDGAVQGVSYGVYADESTIEVNGNITATGVNGTGSDARNGSLITIKGDITAPYYIIVNGNIKTPEQGVPGADADDGYLVYGAGADKVRVRAITAVITITGQPASSLNLTEGAISATLTCAAEVSPAGTPSYLWYRCDNPAKANPVSTGVNTATFTIPAGLTQGTYYYFCRVSAAGAVDVDSNVSTIVVVKTVSSDASLSGLV